MSDKNDKIVIENGIPLPPPRMRAAKYPFNEMEVGDSFFVPDTNRSFTGAMLSSSKRSGRRFATRMIDGGIRVLRVK